MADASGRRRPDSTKRLTFRVAQLCGAIRDILGARRVSVLLYDPSSRTLSPLVSDSPEDKRLRELARKWSRIALDDFPAARTVLLDRHPIAIEDAHRDVRLPAGLAEDFGITSLHLEPLILGEPIGILAIEPSSAAASGDLESVVPLVAASVGRISERRRVSGERPDESFVLDLMEAAASQRSLNGVLQTICERVAQRLSGRRGAIFLLEEGRLAPRMACYADGLSDPEAWERFRGATSPLPLAEAVIESGQPATADDSSSPLLAGSWAETCDLRSVLAVPLGRPGAVIGVLAVESPDPTRFGEAEERLATELGARLGVIVERAREVEQHTSTLIEESAIRRLLEEGARADSIEDAAATLARVTRDALGVEHATVFLADEGEKIGHVSADAPEGFVAIARERLVGAPANTFRLWRRITRQRRPVFVEDAHANQLIPAELVSLLGLKSYAAYPLLSAERVLGIVLCSETREKRHWTPEQRQLVEQLALEGALVIENAALRTRERQQIGELSRQAFHDPLTQLPNRALFADRLDHALARLHRRDESVAVLLLDLDEFKSVNDNFGHEAGDQLLIAVAQRLRGCLRPADTVARLGGDEFTILLEDIQSAREAVRVAERVEASLQTPFVVDGHETSVTTSIGIALNTPGQAARQDLLRNADAAMYRAKHEGKGGYEVHEPGNPELSELAISDTELSIRRSPITGGDKNGEREEDGPAVGEPAE